MFSRKNHFFYASLLILSTFDASFSSGPAPKHFLTFIVPSYNCANTVGESIESIYCQNLSIPFEVICTDDKSKDSTREVLAHYQEKYNNLHVYYHQENKGGAAARNTCVSHAQGDLIFCLDSDNILAPNSVQGLVDLIDQTGCEAAAFKELKYFEGNYKYNKSWFYEAPNNICDITHILKTNFTPGSSGNYLYTKASYNRAGGYPEGSGATDTWRFAFRQHATGTKIAILPNTYYWHRYSEHGYWGRDYRAGTLNKNYFAAILEFPELFTPETQEFIATWNPTQRDLFQDIYAGFFKLIPHDALEDKFLPHQN